MQFVQSKFNITVNIFPRWDSRCFGFPFVAEMLVRVYTYVFQNTSFTNAYFHFAQRRIGSGLLSQYIVF